MLEDLWLPIGLMILGILLVALAAASEMALASLSRLQLREVVSKDRSRAEVAEALISHPARMLSTLLVLKLIGFVLATAGAGNALLISRPASGWAWLWWFLALLAVLILSQLLPRAWVVGRQAQAALWLAPIVGGFAFLLTPITALMRRIGHSAVPEGTSEESIFLSEDGLRFLLNMSEEETTIEDDEKEMIASIFEFGDKLVREVMVPRIDVVGVPVAAPMLDALDVILKGGHSRIPAYSDSIDNVAGILYAKDLLRYLRDGRTDVPLGRILRSAYFIPESKKVDELLQELQQRKVHMAVVVDEYGGTAGLVTIEDLLEEIVGEIQDEYDAEEPAVERLGDQEYLFDARVLLDEVIDLLGVELPAEGGDTLGGFIYSQLGKVPAVGDTIEFQGTTPTTGHWLFEVLTVAGRRIKQVRASYVPEAEAPPLTAEDQADHPGPAMLISPGPR